MACKKVRMTVGQAKAALSRMLRTRWAPEALNIYRCRKCGHWHVGNKSPFYGHRP